MILDLDLKRPRNVLLICCVKEGEIAFEKSAHSYRDWFEDVPAPVSSLELMLLGIPGEALCHVFQWAIVLATSIQLPYAMCSSGQLY